MTTVKTSGQSEKFRLVSAHVWFHAGWPIEKVMTSPTQATRAPTVS
jgi:hypothetical protein